MIKQLSIVFAILAITLAVPVAKRPVSIEQLFQRRTHYNKLNDEVIQPRNVSLLTVVQRVDNFDPTNQNTWEQRYYVNNEFFQPGRPSLLYLGGEWEITPDRLIESYILNIAEELEANMFILEHRFYGGSRPTEDVSDANLTLLNPAQALADAAHFINHIRSTVDGAANSDFIIIGAHYSASLAVWFRQSYPHLTIGAWASSGPLVSVVDFDQYKVGIGAAFRTVGGDSCYDALEAGFDAMQDLVDAGRFDELTEAFRVCWELEPADIPHFFSIMAEVYGLLPTIATEASIRGTCALLQGPGDIIENTAAVLSVVLAPGECIAVDYDYIIEAERQIEWNATAVQTGYRQWSYTLCSQIGWFHSSGSPDQPFGNNFPADVYHEGCEAVFGETFTPARLERNSNRFNTLYGGLEPEVSNVVFVYGQHDPWSVIGRTTDLNDDAISIVIQGATLANDLAPIRDFDSQALNDARRRISELIRQWVDENDDD